MAQRRAGRQRAERRVWPNGAVFIEGAVHDGEDGVDALAAAAAIETDQSGVGGICGHGDAPAGAQHFWKHFCALVPMSIGPLW
jgi:hypothetical protein